MDVWELFPVMVLRFTKMGIEAMPLGIPDNIAQVLHMTIQQQDFDALNWSLAFGVRIGNDLSVSLNHLNADLKTGALRRYVFS